MGAIKNYKDFLGESIIENFDFSKLQSEIEENLKSQLLKKEGYEYVGYITIKELAILGDKYGVLFYDYDQFLNDIPEHDHKDAPKDAPIFGFFNHKHNKANIVFGHLLNEKGTVHLSNIGVDFIMEVLEHESIHKTQFSRNKLTVYNLPNPQDSQAYFSDKMEVMAWSQSLTRHLIDLDDTDPDFNDKLMQKLNGMHIYQTIKNSVHPNILKRYHKYIYLYFQKMKNSDYLVNLFKENQ